MPRTALLLSLCLISPALVAAQALAGGEFRVNTVTTLEQFVPAAAVDGAGNVVVVWTGFQLGQSNIFGQRYDAAGQRVGAEFRVNEFPGTSYRVPSVAAAQGGDFVVAWLRRGVANNDSIKWRRFSASGTPLGPDDMEVTMRTNAPAVAADAAGNFILAWDEPGASGTEIRAQRFDASGVRRGAEFQVNAFTMFDQANPRVAVDGQGSFVIVWESYGQDGSGGGVIGRRYDAAGAALGAEFIVNTYRPSTQGRPKVAAAADGRFAVAWESRDQDGSSYGVFGQAFSASGAPVGGEFRANAFTTGFQSVSGVAADAAGNFTVVWSSDLQDGDSTGAFARRYDAAGTARGTEFRVNTTTAGGQAPNTVASDPHGNFVVGWIANDGSYVGVFAQRFGGLRPVTVAVDAAGNGVLEPDETGEVRPSWRNVNGAAQTVGGSAVALGGPLPASYQIPDAVAAYGTLANGATAACVDCYAVAVAASPRPVLHWDATLEERITPDAHGEDKLWRLHIGDSFTDVPRSSLFYRFVETLLHRAVTGGCGGTQYCPGSSASREQMAVFVLVAKEGSGYQPPACGTPMFADVPASSPFCRWVEELARRGVVSGCGGGNFCPSAAVSREQMPVFVLRTLDPALDPPVCTTSVFADVPASSPFCRWIEELARRGIVSGCGGGNYCPVAAVTREQMAVFIAGTFGLTLYGP